MINNLTKISLIISLFGVLILIILSQQLPVKLYKIEQIDETLLNKKIAINASVQNINDYQGFQVILLKDDTGFIKATTFSKEQIKKTNNNWLIIGTVTEYQDEIQIDADKIIQQ